MAELSSASLERLSALVDQVLPADEHQPGGWAGGVAAYLGAEWNGMLQWAQGPIADALASTGPLDELSPVALDALIRITHEGFYGAATAGPPAGWEMVGFRPRPEGLEPVEPTPPPTTALGSVAATYDTVVIGAGTGGGVVAAALAEAGERVLLVERSVPHPSAQLRDDHLRGKRAAIYEPVAGPDPDETRVHVGADGNAMEVGPAELRWGLNAMTFGGGTRLWQAQAWRFLPEDFRMATTYGVPEGSTAADWPVSYDEMAPFYERAEIEIGVCGDREFLGNYRAQTADFPMPALPQNERGRALGAAADRLGWRSGQLSFAINSVPRDGRRACVGCQQCCGHACPVDAKNGSHNTVLRRALARGGPDLVVGTRALRIETQGKRATAVVITDGTEERQVGAGRVVVSAGAAETPRLLLWSGLGNDHVGRHLQSHFYTLAFGIHAEGFTAWDGPGHSIATLDFNHHNPGIIGGGVVHDGTQFLPVAAASMMAMLFGADRHGPGHTDFMRRDLPRLVSTMACGQEVPSETARVSLDPEVRDRFGVPVVRFSGFRHPADLTMHEFLNDRCVEWLEELDCERVVDVGAGARHFAMDGVTAGEHGAGTCRMGDDPARSATDRFGRVHGTDNVFVADASLHPTNGGLNPGLTVLANSFRIADHLC